MDGARRTPRGDRSARSNRERARRFRSKSFDTRCREGLQPGGPALKFHALVRIRRVAGTRRRAGRARAVGSSDGRGRVAARRALGRRARQVRRASRPFLPPPQRPPSRSRETSSILHVDPFSSRGIPSRSCPDGSPTRPHPTRRSRARSSVASFGNAILSTVDESSAPEPAFGALPARLAHLKGPVAMTTMTPPRIPDERDPHPTTSTSGGAVAPGTPSSAGSPPRALPGKPSTVRGSAGNLLVGPWNGPFAPAHAPPGRVVAPEAGGAKKAMEGSSSRVVASSFSFGHQCSREEDSGLSDSDEFPPPPPPPPPPRASGTARSPITDHREDLADLAFTGPDEMDLDRDAVARTDARDAISGPRRRRPSAERRPPDARRGERNDLLLVPPRDRSPDAASSRASGVPARAPGRRTSSAPAASTRRPRAGPSARQGPAASKRGPSARSRRRRGRRRRGRARARGAGGAGRGTGTGSSAR